MKTKRSISETHNKDLLTDWVNRARQVTTATLPEFIRELTEDYDHDYGTICRAMSACALAACCAVNKSAAGGITGFQASCINWQFSKDWMQWGDEPRRMLDMSHLLYPQYSEQFTSISADCWKWVQAEAQKNLDRKTHDDKPISVHPDVKAHWVSIVSGKVPFGLTVSGQ